MRVEDRKDTRGDIERIGGDLASKGDLSTVNMTKTLVGPRARRDDPFGSLKKNSSKGDCLAEGGREGRTQRPRQR